MDVAVIIPAYNEAGRLGVVLEATATLPAGWRRLVVDDGSTDDTAAVARAHPGVEVLELPHNGGKGAALWAGALAVDTPVLLFLDADLRGVTVEHLERLAAPVLADEAEMTLGLFRGGRGTTDFSHLITPWVTGQRCLRRDRFLSVPEARDSRHGVELLLTQVARRNRWRVRDIPWAGVTHAMKEEKLGTMRGQLARWRMYAEMARTFAATLGLGPRVTRPSRPAAAPAPPRK